MKLLPTAQYVMYTMEEMSPTSYSINDIYLDSLAHECTKKIVIDVMQTSLVTLHNKKWLISQNLSGHRQYNLQGLLLLQ